MQQSFWPTWRNILVKRNLLKPARFLFDTNSALIPLIGQLMFIGMPLVRGVVNASSYQAFVEMLTDENELANFVDYLKGAQV